MYNTIKSEIQKAVETGTAIEIVYKDVDGTCSHLKLSNVEYAYDIFDDRTQMQY